MADSKSNGDGGYEARKYIAELIGTMALVFFGCGAAVLAGKGFGDIAGIGLLGISFAFGMVVMVMVYAIGPISGCHINPAITIAMLAARKISLRDSILYIVMQCIGALIGAELLLWIALGLPNYTTDVMGLGQNGYGALSPMKYSMQSGFIAEVVLTFFFILVIFGATSKEAPKGFAGAAIGFTLFIVHLVGIPVTGTSVNPARSFGPAVIIGGEAFNQLWLFWLAPIIGGLLAAVVWMYLLAPAEPMSREDFERERRAAMEEARRIRMKKMEGKRPAASSKDKDEDEEEEEEEDEDEEEEDEEEDEEEKEEDEEEEDEDDGEDEEENKEKGRRKK